MVDINCECEGHIIETTAILSKDLRDDMLISKRDCKRLGILLQDFPKPQHGNYEQFNKTYEELLKDFAQEKPATWSLRLKPGLFSSTTRQKRKLTRKKKL